MVKNFKRLSKRLIATLLSVILVASVFAALPMTAGATDTWSVNSSSYIMFDSLGYNWTLTRIYALVVAGDKVYVVNMGSGVKDYTKIKYQAINTTSSNSLMKLEGFSWSNVDYITFVTANSGTALENSVLNKTALFSGDSVISGDAVYKISGYTANYSTPINDNTAQRYCFIPASSSNGATLSMEKLDASGGANASQTIRIRDNYGNNVNTNSLGVSVDISTYKSATSLTVSPTDESSQSGVTADTEIHVLYSTSYTLTANQGTATFIGWYDKDNQLVSNNTTITRTVNRVDTLTAKFETPGFPQTANAGEGGTASVSDGNNSGTSITVDSGADVTFTAMPDANYKFDGWYNNSSFTGDAVSTNDPYTIEDVDSTHTLYAKFSSITDTEGVAFNDTNKNGGARDQNETELSDQAKSFYQDELRNVVVYKDAAEDPTEETTEPATEGATEEPSEAAEETGTHTFSEGNTNVYRTFEDYAEKEDNDASNSYNAAQNNTLYTALHNIMKNTHSHGVSYSGYGPNALATYWLYTDTSSKNYGREDNRHVYTMFYSDEDCFNDVDMQREHIWPKSKASYYEKTGLGGSDLHHLRPSYKTVNNIKSNWGFADIKTENGSGGYSLNTTKTTWSKLRTVEYPQNQISLWRAEDSSGQTFIDVKDDVRGDVARILLYVYTRWQQPNLYSNIVDGNGDPDTSKLPDLDSDDSKDTGERVIYDLDTLLKWMKEDPVSKWEMKRNDLTEDIQGNRNVFIDYPELAWLMFDQTVPSDMDTPSGMAKDQDNSENTDIQKTNDNRHYDDPISIDFSSVSGNGKADIKAYNNTAKKYVKDGDRVDRGDIITYTIKPDQSAITTIKEYKSIANSGAGMVNTIATLNSVTSEYSFTRRAGYYAGVPNVDPQSETNYKKERIKVTLNSQVCELSFKINSKTATGNAGGSGSGMVTAMRNDTKAVLENGDTVPNGTSVTLYFTPDYGSRFAGLTYVNTQTAESISGTSSYKYTTTLDCSSGIARTRKFTVYFAQTWNAGAADPDKDKHINNKGMRPDAEDPYGDRADFTENFEICGVQVKHDDNNSENKALRFISVIDKNILAKAESYGYVIGFTNMELDNKTINRYAYNYVKDGNTRSMTTIDCTGTSNSSFDTYGDNYTETNYKYITIAINNIQAGGTIGLNTKLIARPYVELKDEYVGEGAPEVIYGQYVDTSTGEAFCACSGSYSEIAG